jgi:oxygen-independent coproporphyrinogen-3 oxidase
MNFKKVSLFLKFRYLAGIYLHIPFCKQACHYCNFHFSTSLKLKTPLIEAILKEIELQKDYLQGQKIDTIYFGGGTPSLLEANELNEIFKKLDQYFVINPDAEITLEANPDDLKPDKIQILKDSPVNRLSIGIQSFSEADLKFMNRAHNAREAIESLELVKKAGFDNLTIDLIYGTPTMSDAQWEKNIQTAFNFEIPHLSCYCLTVEPQTALDHFVKKGKAAPVDDAVAAFQFQVLMEKTSLAGYEHYEISNFAKPGWYSRHNSSYWKGAKYLGLGPGAHSFNGTSRQWNLPNNPKYIAALESEKLLFEKEELSRTNLYNELVMTGLRTIWGVEKEKIIAFGSDILEHFQKNILPFMANGDVKEQDGNFVLTPSGKLLADRIAMELFMDEP